jgi:hypothetical protein
MRYAIVALLICTSSCRLIGADGSEEPIDGWWHWVESTGGIIGARINADSVDYSQSLHFTGQFHAYWFLDDELVQVYGLSRESREDGDVLMMRPYRTESMFRMKMWIDATDAANGGLILHEACADCYAFYFVRER